jgi:hypothetical protein
MYQKIKNDSQKKLQPIEKKGVSCAVHYRSLTPNNFVPPLLHMEIGMVNQAWEDLVTWIDDVVEKIPFDEKTARFSVLEAKDNLNNIAKEREEAKKTISIEIREKNAELKLLKGELKRVRNNEIAAAEIHTRITLLNAFVTEQKVLEKRLKEKYAEAQLHLSNCKKQLEALKVERGKPESSIMADDELSLKNFNICSTSYHGGDFNGVCCRRLVENAKAVTDELRTILTSKRDQSCEIDVIISKLNRFEATLGLLDAAFAYLNIYHPTSEEKSKTKEAVDYLAKHWRNIGLSVTLKAHVLEKHVCAFNEKWGVGDKEESFVEQGHQVGLKDDRRYHGLTTFEKRTESLLKARSIKCHPLVQVNQSKILEYSRRRKRAEHEVGQPKQVKKENVKVEKKVKRENYISKFKDEK